MTNKQLSDYIALTEEMGIDDPILSKYNKACNALSKLLKRDFAILTAENPNNKRASKAYNARVTKQLSEELIASGYEFDAVQGDYGNGLENSYLIHSCTVREALEIARKYNQESVVINDGLLYATGKLNPVNKDNPLKISLELVEYFSQILIDGLPVRFRYNIDFSKLIDFA